MSESATPRPGGWLSRRLPPRQKTLTDTLQEEMPHEIKQWWFALGGTPAFLFVVQIVTGILLAIYYRPDPESAYESVRFITEEVAFGWFIRSLHKWAATFMVAAVALHHIRVYFTSAYRYLREINWMIGTLLLGCTLMTAFTGYSLGFEQLSYWGATVGANVAARVPIIGDLARQAMFGGETYNATTLSRFFIMHAAILPVIMVVLIAIHLLLVRVQGVDAGSTAGAATAGAESTAPATDESKKAKRGPYKLLPDHALTELIVVLVLLITLSALATALPAGLGEEADPLATPEVIKPEWFFYPMFRWLKLFSGTAALLTLGMAVFGALLWPFIERLLLRFVRVPTLSIWIGLVVVFLLLGLTVWEAAVPH